VASRGVSSVSTFACLSIPTRLGHQKIEPARRNIGFELAIPFRGVKIREPCAERRPIFGRQSSNGVF
jgi:hypothetical protein